MILTLVLFLPLGGLERDLGFDLDIVYVRCPR